MTGWGVFAIFAAVAVTAISANFATFPEIARERSESRIVSGWEAEEGQFPYQMSLRMVSAVGGVSSCGATLIHQQWGLTAAHCTAGRVSFVLRAGVVNLTLPEIIFETTEYYNYPEYNEALPSVVQPHDIGLLGFGRVLTLSDNVQPIRLQRSDAMNENYAGVQLTASGWGRTWTNGDSPENLNWVYLTGVSNLICFLQFGTIVHDSTICASGYNVTSQSTCQGDSGGPLTAMDEDGVASQVGVISFVSGTGCHTNVPAGFIRPGHYHGWFREVTGIDFDWVYTPTTAAPDTTTVTTEAATTESVTTEAATTEAATTEAATTEAATTEAATTEAATTEAATTEAATTEAATTEAATTEAATTEAATTEAATTEAATTEAATTEAATTEPATTEATTTEAATTEAATTEAATTEAATTEAATTEAATTADPEAWDLDCDDEEDALRVHFVNN